KSGRRESRVSAGGIRRSTTAHVVNAAQHAEYAKRVGRGRGRGVGATGGAGARIGRSRRVLGRHVVLYYVAGGHAAHQRVVESERVAAAANRSGQRGYVGARSAFAEKQARGVGARGQAAGIGNGGREGAGSRVAGAAQRGIRNSRGRQVLHLEGAFVGPDVGRSRAACIAVKVGGNSADGRARAFYLRRRGWVDVQEGSCRARGAQERRIFGYRSLVAVARKGFVGGQRLLGIGGGGSALHVNQVRGRRRAGVVQVVVGGSGQVHRSGRGREVNARRTKRSGRATCVQVNTVVIRIDGRARAEVHPAHSRQAGRDGGLQVANQVVIQRNGGAARRIQAVDGRARARAQQSINLVAVDGRRRYRGVEAIHRARRACAAQRPDGVAVGRRNGQPRVSQIQAIHRAAATQARNGVVEELRAGRTIPIHRARSPGASYAAELVVEHVGGRSAVVVVEQVRATRVCERGVGQCVTRNIQRGRRAVVVEAVHRGRRSREVRHCQRITRDVHHVGSRRAAHAVLDTRNLRAGSAAGQRDGIIGNIEAGGGAVGRVNAAQRARNCAGRHRRRGRGRGVVERAVNRVARDFQPVLVGAARAPARGRAPEVADGVGGRYPNFVVLVVVGDAGRRAGREVDARQRIRYHVAIHLVARVGARRRGGRNGRSRSRRSRRAVNTDGIHVGFVQRHHAVADDVELAAIRGRSPEQSVAKLHLGRGRGIGRVFGHVDTVDGHVVGARQLNHPI
nr:hypothetical protein [Tanacetum cinerariifolium]